jgi:phage terminase large subunit
VTTPTIAEVAADRREEPREPIEQFARALREALARLTMTVWPSRRWRDDPAGFALEVLGMVLLPHQVEILEAIRDNEQTAVASGQKIGKTATLIVAALWWYCTREDARVIMTATTSPQVDRVLYRELKRRHRRAIVPIDGELGELARTGLKAHDFREVLGFTAKEVEAVAGVSGADLLYIVDEASSLSQPIFEAITGNLASGTGRIAMTSNPTRSDGPFFDVFHHKAKGWKLLRYSSEDIAKSTAGHEVPGIASLSRIERWREDWGEESVFYRVRVKGEFILNEQGRAIDLASILAAQDRYDEGADEEGEGLCSIGLDPAGPGAGGDETVFAIVRGTKLVALFGFHGLNEDAIVVHLQSFVQTYRRGDEIPQVVLDIEGPIGSALGYRLAPMSDDLIAKRPREAFRFYGVKASAPARRSPLIYERTRDELVANLHAWLQTGAIPRDHRLEVDLHAAEWQTTTAGKLKLTAKDDIRARIGRSPDRADALALAVWSPAPWLEVKGSGDDANGPRGAFTRRALGSESNPRAPAGAFDAYAFAAGSMGAGASGRR